MGCVLPALHTLRWFDFAMECSGCSGTNLQRDSNQKPSVCSSTFPLHRTMMQQMVDQARAQRLTPLVSQVERFVSGEMASEEALGSQVPAQVATSACLELKGQQRSRGP